MKSERPKGVDTVLLGLIIFLIVVGFMIFYSASLGLMAREGVRFSSIATGQFLFGVVGGSIMLFIMSNVYYRHLRRLALYLFILTVLATVAVFIPGIGLSHGGATRWLDIGITTVQPSEFLKIGFVIYLATWLSGVQARIRDWRYGLMPFAAITGIVAVLLLLQPDTGTFLVTAAAGIAIFVAAGAHWRDIAKIFLAGVILLATIAFMRPYVLDRITTFLHPESDPLGSGYQIQQSLIAVGSGGVTGRGFGQSIQKFAYLPEPIGDSIFAVYAEEFGFVGSLFLITIFVFLTLRGYRTATEADDIFGTLLVVGFMTLIAGQAFLNIGAMIAVAPLSGLPLPFISHGGTALMATLAALGIVLNVSKYRTARARA